MTKATPALSEIEKKIIESQRNTRKKYRDREKDRSWFNWWYGIDDTEYMSELASAYYLRQKIVDLKIKVLQNYLKTKDHQNSPVHFHLVVDTKDQ